jgi:glycosyltransferase involved in cell wall biosynthesis
MSSNNYIDNSYKKKRIAVFHNLHRGGGARALIELCRGLSDNFIIDLYTINKSLNKDFMFCNTIKTYSFTFSNNFVVNQCKIYFSLKSLHKSIAKDVNSSNYCLALVSHDVYTKSPYIIKYLNIPSIYLCHEPPREFYEKKFLFSSSLKYWLVNYMRLPLKFVDRTNVKKASIIVANSKYSQNILIKIYKRSVKRIKLGVDSNFFRPLEVTCDKFYLGVGALAKFKGHDFIIRSISKLPQRLRYPYYVVANGGRDEKYIVKLAKKLKVELKIIRKASDVDLLELYNKASLFLFGSHQEPFGLVILEALSCGCPVVAVDEGGVSEIIRKKYLGALAPRNECEFSDSIMAVVSRKNNRIKIRKYITDNWCWSKSVIDLMKLLENTINNENSHNTG